MRQPGFAITCSIVAVSMVLMACGAGSAPTGAQDSGGDLQGNLAVSGAFALYPMMTLWAAEYSELHPGVTFDVQAGGAGKGMTDTLAGAVDIGMISRGIKPEEEAQGAFWVAVAKDAVFPIVSAQNPVLDQLNSKGITPEMFKGIFITGNVTTWGQIVGDPGITDEIHVYGRSDSAGAAVQWALFAGGGAQADLLGIAVNGEPAHVDTVRKDPLGIGFSNLNSTFDPSTSKPIDGILVPPMDINGSGTTDPGEHYEDKAAAVAAIADGTYPSPPSRFEFLATKGQPTGLALEFITWILKDGQAFLEAAGYVPLSPDEQAESLGKIN